MDFVIIVEMGPTNQINKISTEGGGNKIKIKAVLKIFVIISFFFSFFFC